MGHRMPNVRDYYLTQSGRLMLHVNSNNRINGDAGVAVNNYARELAVMSDTAEFMLMLTLPDLAEFVQERVDYYATPRDGVLYVPQKHAEKLNGLKEQLEKALTLLNLVKFDD